MIKRRNVVSRCMDNSAQNSMPENLAYDLRQRYAKIVGDQLEIVAICRREKAYMEYFTALDDLHTITQHRFKEEKNTKKEGEEVVKDYTTLKQTCINVSTKFAMAWNKQTENPEEIAQIERALRDIEMWLYMKMNEANMFGSKRGREHLS